MLFFDHLSYFKIILTFLSSLPFHPFYLLDQFLDHLKFLDFLILILRVLVLSCFYPVDNGVTYAREEKPDDILEYERNEFQQKINFRI